MEVYKLSGYSYVTVAKIAKDEIKKIDFDLCEQPKETLEKYYKRQTVKPNLLVNAGFFNMSDGSTIFTVLNEHTVVHGEDWVKQGIGILGDKNVYFGNVTDYQWRDFMSAYPPLVVNGKAYNTTMASDLNYKARRTVFGFNDTYIFVICVDNPGMNFSQLKTICINMGCQFAVNFDGGGSTRMLVNGVRKTVLTSNRPVDTVLAVYLETKTKDVDYYISTTVSALNVRKEPTTNESNIVNCIRNMKNTYHIIKETADGKWGYIQDMGWIYLTYTKKLKNYVSIPVDITKTYKVKVTTAVLRIRKEASTNSSIVGRYYKNNIVIIYEDKDGWGRTDKGWIYMPSLTKRL